MTDASRPEGPSEAPGPSEAAFDRGDFHEARALAHEALRSGDEAARRRAGEMLDRLRADPFAVGLVLVALLSTIVIGWMTLGR